MADKNNGRKYRNWSKNEDAKLVEALVNMVDVGGYKADNGFKSRYLQHLEQALKVSLPNSNILPRPHIESRMKTMKKDWQIVHDMLHGTNTSGFWCPHYEKFLDPPLSVWDSYLQVHIMYVHKEATKWKNKPFPHYEDLSYVFGKDRAHGNQARDYDGLDDENDVMEDNPISNEDQQSDEHMEYTPEDSHMPSQECSSQGTRKRKSRGDPLVDAIKNVTVILGDKIGKALDKLVVIEMEIHHKKSIVGSELAKMDLTPMEKFTALRKITCDPEAVLSFWDCEEGVARLEFVRYMLQE
ncbi:hypothetical protein OSB04_024407 [Centaurea solstitialis]|uniref:Myb/SANT-like domain-containing protein n=1 Tax=Centaurea solstitialis TaxID=347529 RepID=A0AA38WAB1_9ASTR|nr:hypothetical protein OSB04_024407 [Centaurea solstitialis]